MSEGGQAKLPSEHKRPKPAINKQNITCSRRTAKMELIKEKLLKKFTPGSLMGARQERRRGWFWTLNQLLFLGLIGALLVRWLRLREEENRRNGDYDLEMEELQLERYEPEPAATEVDLSGAMKTTGVDYTPLTTVPMTPVDNQELREEAAQIVEEAAEEQPTVPFAGSTLLEEGAEASEALREADVPERGSGTPEAAVSAVPGRDDLIALEGIGPKISEILHNAGIYSYRQLAETDVSRLNQILQENNLRLADPTTWPEQAKLLAEGDMEGFNSLKDKLKAGRRV
jgi:predicted flap endonuclease-1-like 5' DNA nuclease